MDVGTVYAYAAGFAHAVSNQDSVLISSYLSEELRGSIPKVLAGLPVPIRTAEVLSVTAPEDERCISLTRFNGFRGGVLLRAIWAEEVHPLMCTAQIV